MCLREEVTDAGGANTDEHLYEVRARDAQEWHIRLSSHRLLFTTLHLALEVGVQGLELRV